MSLKLDQLSVLVVEDLQPMQELILNVLRHLGIKRLNHANDGESAYVQFQRYNPDIILTDWEMEPNTGLQLAQWIRRDSMSINRNIPIIVITGYASEQRVSAARDVGITEFLVKPFTANDIAKRISYVINNPRDFVETQEFYGPDRRRRTKPVNGEERRGRDMRAGDRR